MERINKLPDSPNIKIIKEKGKRREEKINDYRRIHKESLAQEEKPTNSSFQRKLRNQNQKQSKYPKHKVRNVDGLVILHILLNNKYIGFINNANK